MVAIQDEKSQHKNKAKALAVLRARLLEMEQQRQAEERGEQRRSQVGSGERSEKIRTYNFPDDRVTDHRIGLTVHNLPGLLEGDLDRLIEPLAEPTRPSDWRRSAPREPADRGWTAGRRGGAGSPRWMRPPLGRLPALDPARPLPRLDAELLVSHAFGRDRTWLHAHPEARSSAADVARAARLGRAARRGRADRLHPRLQGVVRPCGS